MSALDVVTFCRQEPAVVLAGFSDILKCLGVVAASKFQSILVLPNIYEPASDKPEVIYALFDSIRN